MVGQALKSIRGIYGYKAKEVADELGISAGYLSEIESEKKQPSLEMIEAFSKFYKIRMSSIFYLAEEIPDDSNNGELRNSIRNRAFKIIEILGKSAITDNDE